MVKELLNEQWEWGAHEAQKILHEKKTSRPP
jgi:hypothetical protein